MKLSACPGFPGLDNVFELYDLESDPEELKDLADRGRLHSGRLIEELLTTLEAANRACTTESGFGSSA